MEADDESVGTQADIVQGVVVLLLAGPGFEVAL